MEKVTRATPPSKASMISPRTHDPSHSDTGRPAGTAPVWEYWVTQLAQWERAHGLRRQQSLAQRVRVGSRKPSQDSGAACETGRGGVQCGGEIQKMTFDTPWARKLRLENILKILSEPSIFSCTWSTTRAYSIWVMVPFGKPLLLKGNGIPKKKTGWIFRMCWYKCQAKSLQDHHNRTQGTMGTPQINDKNDCMCQLMAVLRPLY